MNLNNENLAVMAKKTGNKSYINILYYKNKTILSHHCDRLYEKYKKSNKGYLLEYSDFEVTAYDAIIDAVKCYNPNKNFRFTTYLIRAYESNIRRKVLNCTYDGKLKRDALNYSIPLEDIKEEENVENINCENEFEISIYNEEVSKIWEVVENVLKERYFIFLYERYFNKLTFQQIGEKYNVTRQRVQSVVNKALEKLKCNKTIQDYKIFVN